MSDQKNSLQRLDDLPAGVSGVITELGPEGPLTARMTALGLARGRTVEMIRKVRLGSTLQVRVGNTHIALRAAEAGQIKVELIAR